MPTVLVYSHDPAVREQVRLAAGRLPGGRELGPVEYVEASASGAVVRAVGEGGIDALVLDGEAWPTGGLGLCRQLKSEITDCPPVVVLIARAADKWLGTWSLADAVLLRPVDPIELSTTVAGLLRAAAGHEPAPERRARFGLRRARA